MQFKHLGILLQIIPYSDHSVVLKVFTRGEGLQSFMYRKSRKQKTTGILQPLSLLEIESFKKPATDLHTVKELKPHYRFQTIGSSYSKNTVILFLNELLLQALREPGYVIEELFDFIQRWLMDFDEEERAGEKHLFFLAELCVQMGIQPLNNFSAAHSCFDVAAARFIHSPMGNQLTFNKEDSLLFHSLLFGKEKTPLSREQKKQMAECFITYFQVHLPGVKEIKSLPVLKEILD
ncbi:MAG: DNA repair protein RecO [Bacteroidota bacterium]